MQSSPRDSSLVLASAWERNTQVQGMNLADDFLYTKS